MPIVDISGLTSDKKSLKVEIRQEIKKYFANRLNIHEDSTTVTFIMDETADSQEHVMARMYSKGFMKMSLEELEHICDDVVTILEKAGHQFNEAFPIPIMTMRGRFSRNSSQ